MRLPSARLPTACLSTRLSTRGRLRGRRTAALAPALLALLAAGAALPQACAPGSTGGLGASTVAPAGAPAGAAPGAGPSTAPTPPGGAPSTPPPAAAGAGTAAAPFRVARFPYVHAGDTTLSPSADLDVYTVAPSTLETGPEVYYELALPGRGTLVVELDEDPGVDVDLHLLRSLARSGATATDAIARANTRLVVEGLDAGTYMLVVDSYARGGQTFAGAYRVAIEHDVPDVWQTVSVAGGVTWRRQVRSPAQGGPQTIHAVEVDPAAPGVEVGVRWTGSCITTSAASQDPLAVVAVNGGFFGSGCESLCLVRQDGALRATHRVASGPGRALGITAAGELRVETVARGADWPQARHALSGYPTLVRAGQVDIQPSSSSSFFTSRHPRTAVGLTARDTLLLVAVDGRTTAGRGMTMRELADLLRDLGAVEAFNLDGGGSTAMWIRGMSLNGIVNHPSDNGAADHEGERRVSDGLVIRVR